LVPGQRDAQLPLSGVHLPGGVQRIRTAEDQRDMRNILQEGDWISAEVHNVQKDGSLVLHTRSLRYGKLANGCWISVPPALIPRRKNHYMTMMNLLDVLWGTNGYIWIQRKLPLSQQSAEEDLAERQEELRKEHAATPVDYEERQAICRFRNAIECLRLVHCLVSPENVQAIYEQSKNLRPADMLHPQNIIELTASLRQSK
jgi:exosome complex component RRP4